MTTNYHPASFSFTAPQFSVDQLQCENASLSKDATYTLTCEKHGYNPILRETPEMRQRGLAQFEEALQGVSDKREYLRAVELAPELVRTESDPLRFLRCDNYDAWAAALRLTMYWKMRCKLFGDRAFLPMTQTGEGALTNQDVERLREGAMRLVDPDKMGRAVIYIRRAAVTRTTQDGPIMVSTKKMDISRLTATMSNFEGIFPRFLKPFLLLLLRPLAPLHVLPTLCRL
jgi:hypothetical protein